MTRRTVLLLACVALAALGIAFFSPRPASERARETRGAANEVEPTPPPALHAAAAGRPAAERSNGVEAEAPVLEARSRTSRDVVSAPPAAGVEGLAASKPRRLRGRVVDPDGAAVPLAGVILWNVDLDGGTLLSSTDADESGVFDLPAPRGIGAVELMAWRSPWLRSERVLVALQPEDDVDGILLGLRTGGRIEGVVLDGDGLPVADCRVECHSHTEWSPGDERTSEEGTFAFERLEAVDHLVSASIPIDGDVRREVFVTADVRVGETTAVTIRSSVEDPIRAFGRVHSRNVGVEGIALSFRRSGGETPFVVHTTSGVDGEFEVVLDGPGAYGVDAHTPDADEWSSSRHIEVPAVDAFRHDVELASGSISGVVFDAEGRPLPATHVILSPDARFCDLRPRASYGERGTDGDGAFRFDGLEPGTYTLEATATRADAVRTAHRDGIELALGQSLDGVDLRVEGTGSVHGLVTAPEGRPDPDACVHVYDPGGRRFGGPHLARSVGPIGRFEQALPAGRYTLVARARGLVSSFTAPVEIREGESRDVHLVLGEGASLVVRVLESDGHPVGAAIRLYDREDRDLAPVARIEGWRGTETTPEDGMRFEGIPPGRYRVVALNHSAEGPERTVVLAPGEPTEVTLRFGE